MFYAEKKNKGLSRGAAVTIAIALALNCLFPINAWAGRSRAGGGDVAKTDFGDIATSVGITVGSAIGTQVISGAVNSASQAATSQQYSQSATRIFNEAESVTQRAMDANNMQLAEQGMQVMGEADKVKMVADISEQGAALSHANTALQTLGESAKTADIANNISTISTKISSSGGILSSSAHAAHTVGNLFTDSSHLGAGISSVSNFSAVMPTVVSGFNTYVATSQTARAVGMAGYYYGWKPSTTYVVSSVTTGGVAGALNPEIALGANKVNTNSALGMTRGAAVGSLTGLGSSLGTVYVDQHGGGDRIDKGESPNALAAITGKVTGLMSANLGRTMMDPDTYRKLPDGIIEQRSAREMAEQDPEGKVLLEKIKTYNPDRIVRLKELEEEAKVLQGDEAKVANEAAQYRLRSEMAADVKAFDDFQKKYYGETYTFLKVAGVNKQGQTLYASREEGQAPYFGRNPEGKYAAIRDVDLNYSKDFAGREFKGVIPDTYALQKTDKAGLGLVLGRYGQAAFIETFNSQNWPGLASQSMGIWASSQWTKGREYLSPLVQGMVSGVTSPIFRNMATIYGVDSELLLGRIGVGYKDDITQARLRYNYGVLSMAENEYMADRAKKLTEIAKAIKGEKTQYSESGSMRKLYADYKDIKTADGLNKVAKKLTPFVEDSEQPGVWTKPDFPLLDSAAMVGGSKEQREEAATKLASNLSPEKGLGITAQKQQDAAVGDTLDEMSKAKTEADVANINKGLILQEARSRLVAGMSRQPTGDALAIAETNRNKLFMNNTLRGVVAGAFEGGISGGIESAMEKNYPAEGSVVTQFLRPYTVTMLAATVRGLSWYYNWDRMSRQWEWQERLDYAKPEPYSLKPGDRGYNIIADKLDTFEQDNLQFYKLAYAVKATPGNGLNYHDERKEWTRQYVDKGDGTKEEKWVVKDAPKWMLSLSFPRDPIRGKPALTEAIARSVEQANMDYFTSTFTFGRPMTLKSRTDEWRATTDKTLAVALGAEKLGAVVSSSLLPAVGPLTQMDAISEALSANTMLNKAIGQAKVEWRATPESSQVREVYGIDPKNISAYSFMTYLNNIGNLSGKGLQDAVLYQSRAANIGTTTQTGAAAKGLAGALLATPGVAQLTYMQPERFVKVETFRQAKDPWERTTTAVALKVEAGKTEAVKPAATATVNVAQENANLGPVLGPALPQVIDLTNILALNTISQDVKSPDQQGPIVAPPDVYGPQLPVNEPGKPGPDFKQGLIDTITKPVPVPRGAADSEFRPVFVLHGGDNDKQITGGNTLPYVKGSVNVTDKTVKGVDITAGVAGLGSDAAKITPFTQGATEGETSKVNERGQVETRTDYLKSWLMPTLPLGKDTGIGYSIGFRLVGVRTVEKGIETAYVPMQAPGLTSTVQQAGFGTGAHMGFSFYAPFPHPFYGSRTQTGASLDFLRRTGSDTSSQQTALSGESLTENNAPDITNPFGEPITIPAELLTSKKGFVDTSLEAYSAALDMFYGYAPPVVTKPVVPVHPPAAPPVPQTVPIPQPVVPASAIPPLKPASDITADLGYRTTSAQDKDLGMRQTNAAQNPKSETIPVAVDKSVAEFKGSVDAVKGALTPLATEQAVQSNADVSFRLEGNASPMGSIPFMPGSPPPEAVPVFGPLGPSSSDIAPNPFIGNEVNPDIVRSGDTTYIPNKDKTTALAVKPTADGKTLELSVVPSSEVPSKPLTPIEPMVVPGSGKSIEKAGSYAQAPQVPAAAEKDIGLNVRPTPEGNYELSVGPKAVESKPATAVALAPKPVEFMPFLEPAPKPAAPKPVDDGAIYVISATAGGKADVVKTDLPTLADNYLMPEKPAGIGPVNNQPQPEPNVGQAIVKDILTPEPRVTEATLPRTANEIKAAADAQIKNVLVNNQPSAEEKQAMVAAAAAKAIDISKDAYNTAKQNISSVASTLRDQTKAYVDSARKDLSDINKASAQYAESITPLSKEQMESSRAQASSDALKTQVPAVQDNYPLKTIAPVSQPQLPKDIAAQAKGIKDNLAAEEIAKLPEKNTTYAPIGTDNALDLKMRKTQSGNVELSVVPAPPKAPAVQDKPVTSTAKENIAQQQIDNIFLANQPKPAAPKPVDDGAIYVISATAGGKADVVKTDLPTLADNYLMPEKPAGIGPVNDQPQPEPNVGQAIVKDILTSEPRVTEATLPRTANEIKAAADAQIKNVLVNNQPIAPPLEGYQAVKTAAPAAVDNIGLNTRITPDGKHELSVGPKAVESKPATAVAPAPKPVEFMPFLEPAPKPAAPKPVDDGAIYVISATAGGKADVVKTDLPTLADNYLMPEKPAARPLTLPSPYDVANPWLWDINLLNGTTSKLEATSATGAYGPQLPAVYTPATISPESDAVLAPFDFSAAAKPLSSHKSVFSITTPAFISPLPKTVNKGSTARKDNTAIEIYATPTGPKVKK